ncbi:MAG: CAP domain-containing protein [Leptolyngbyaceae cyanobacterium]
MTTSENTQQFLELVNQARIKAGLVAVTLNEELSEAALNHSQDIAKEDLGIVHTGSDGSTPGERVTDAGYEFKVVVENVGGGYYTADEAFQDWMNSPGHRANILNPDVRHLGAGHVLLANDTGNKNYVEYWTLVLADGASIPEEPATPAPKPSAPPDPAPATPIAEPKSSQDSPTPTSPQVLDTPPSQPKTPVTPITSAPTPPTPEAQPDTLPAPMPNSDSPQGEAPPSLNPTPVPEMPEPTEPSPVSESPVEIPQPTVLSPVRDLPPDTPEPTEPEKVSESPVETLQPTEPSPISELPTDNISEEPVVEVSSGETIAGDGGDDQIAGSNGNDILRGDFNRRDPGNDMGGNDTIYGLDGDDRIGGKGGNDQLFGDQGDDTIWGDDGDDLLYGGLGNDVLTGDNFSGGSGADKFVLAAGAGTDTITDFETGTDLIGLAIGLAFDDLSLGQHDDVATISADGEVLAQLNTVVATGLTREMFVVVQV